MKSSYAIRDIKKGDEWFEDYGDYDYPAWLMKILKQHKCDLSYFDINKKS